MMVVGEQTVIHEESVTTEMMEVNSDAEEDMKVCASLAFKVVKLKLEPDMSYRPLFHAYFYLTSPMPAGVDSHNSPHRPVLCCLCGSF